MSAIPVRTVADGDHADHAGHAYGETGLAGLLGGPPPETAPEPPQVEVRRNAAVPALIGIAASAIATAYLYRAVDTSSVSDWAWCAGMALVAVTYLVALLDARTPLLVADELGVRVRLGTQWRAVPWEAVEQVVVSPRHGPLRDGRLLVLLHHVARAVEGLDGRSRRAARQNQRRYGAALAVPLGLTTRAGGPQATLAGRLDALADGRADVVTAPPRGALADLAAPGPGPAPAEPAEPAEPAAAAAQTDAQPVAGSDQPPARPPAAGPARRLRWGRRMRADRSAGQPDQPPPAKEAGPAPAGPKAGELEAGEPVAVEPDAEPTAEPIAEPDSDGPRPGRGLRRRLGTAVSRAGSGRRRDLDGSGAPPPALGQAAGPSAAPGEVTRPGATPLAPAARAVPLLGDRGGRVPPTVEATAQGAAALAPQPGSTDELPESVVLRRPDVDPFGLGGADPARPGPPAALPDDARVSRIATLGDPVEPPVVDDFATEPAYDPVIGPELAAARTRVGLTVDELAERTRIRPHVIESIEVDDFAPCGGDFYARGHIRTLARVLGQDADPMLRHFEARYATAPVSPRRVFEAELATGLGGTGRRASGGPNWSLLVALVLVLVLVWSAVRLFAGDDERMLENPPPVLNGSQGLGGYDLPSPAAPRPVEARLVAQGGGTHVRVTDADDVVVFEGDLATDEEVTVHGDPPLTVSADDGGVLEVTVAGQDRGLLGQPGQPGQPAEQTYPRR